MVEALIISGVPGSGKSTAANHIIEDVEQYGAKANRIGDYDILYKKFLNEEKCQLPESERRFHRVDHGGFYVIDRTVYDEALSELIHSIDTISSQDIDLVIVEFARSDFISALQKFEKDFLKRSSYMFLNADIATCKDRVRRRIKRDYPPETLDDHYVSDYTFEFYQGKDNEDYLKKLRSELVSTFRIEFSKVSIIDSSGSWDATVPRVDKVVKPLLPSVPAFA